MVSLDSKGHRRYSPQLNHGRDGSRWSSWGPVVELGAGGRAGGRWFIVPLFCSVCIIWAFQPKIWG